MSVLTNSHGTDPAREWPDGVVLLTIIAIVAVCLALPVVLR